MRGWKDGYMTRAGLLADIKRVVKKDHPDLDGETLLVNLLTPWREVRFPTGLVCKFAKVRLRAQGFRTADRFVEQKRNEKWSMY